MVRDASDVGWMEAVARRRDREAFRRLYEYFAPRVKSYMMVGGAHPVQAEELTQEVMFTVWDRAELYDPARSAVSTWIFAIARNRRIDALRRERRPEPDPDDPAFVADAPPEAERIVSGLESLDELRAAMARLPDEQAAVLRWFYTEDLSHQQIASAHHIPVGTVKSRLRLAVTHLRQMLVKEEDSG